MLKRLVVQNLALIKNIEIDFEEGINVITGETGSGKSIILSAVSAAFGGKFSKDVIRNGEDTAYIEALVYVNDSLKEKVEEIGIAVEEDGALIISREININGKGIAKVNMKMVPVYVLKRLGELLIDIHGQYDNQSLLRVETHLELLDNFIGESVEIHKEKYRKVLNQFKADKESLDNILKSTEDTARRTDILKYQIDEIEKAELTVFEDRELSEKRNILVNAEKILKSLEETYFALADNYEGKSVLDSLSTAVSNLSGIKEYGDVFFSLSEKLDGIYYELTDIVEDIRKSKEEYEVDDQQINDIESRIDLINNLKRKYGSTIEEILEYLDNAKNELEIIENADVNCEKLKNDIEREQKELEEAAYLIYQRRIEYAEIIGKNITAQLADLDMSGAEFEIRVEHNRGMFLKDGSDKVEFYICANKGEIMKPLSKIASGGEMSRVMLAIKTVFSKVDSIPTMVFDEIDSGISGVAAQRVAEKLTYISFDKQSICVTHLPQIASIGNNHIFVEKNEENGRVSTCITKLDREGRIKEIARIIAGDNVSDTTLKQAAELLE